MYKEVPGFIEGALFQDERGEIISCNGFSMAEVQRMYIVDPASAGLIRAWQAHKLEQKWFFCLDGSFEINLIAIDDFENPAEQLPAYHYSLSSANPGILYVPGGYANGFMANSENSRLLVYSNFNLTQSKADDYRYPADKWNIWGT